MPGPLPMMAVHKARVPAGPNGPVPPGADGADSSGASESITICAVFMNPSRLSSSLNVCTSLAFGVTPTSLQNLYSFVFELARRPSRRRRRSQSNSLRCWLGFFAVDRSFLRAPACKAVAADSARGKLGVVAEQCRGIQPWIAVWVDVRRLRRLLRRHLLTRVLRRGAPNSAPRPPPSERLRANESL